MPNQFSLLKLLRQTHLYVGVFIAPAILFFAFTGSLQTFSLHETTPGSAYKPPAWIVTLAQLHKDQTIIVPARKLHPAPANKPIATDKPAAPKPPDAPQKTHLAMKIFFLLVAISLFTSTLTGITMSYKYNRNKFVVTGLLLAGIIIPLILTRF
jgi:hypothetical protein